MQGMQSTLLAGSNDALRKIVYDRVISKLTIFFKKGV